MRYDPDRFEDDFKPASEQDGKDATLTSLDISAFD